MTAEIWSATSMPDLFTSVPHSCAGCGQVLPGREMLAHVCEAHGFRRFALFTSSELGFLLAGAIWARDHGFAQPPIALHEEVVDELAEALDAVVDREAA